MPQIPVPLIRGHLQCRDTFAWPDRCPYKTGSTVMQNSLALSDPKIAQNSKFSWGLTAPPIPPARDSLRSYLIPHIFILFSLLPLSSMTNESRTWSIPGSIPFHLYVAVNLKSSAPLLLAACLWISYGYFSRVLQVLISKGWHVWSYTKEIIALNILISLLCDTHFT